MLQLIQSVFSLRINSDDNDGQEPSSSAEEMPKIDNSVEVQTGDAQQESDIPVELQYHEVDMNDPLMDPLEWTVRKVVPIPRAYFWETGNHDLPWKIKLWHRTVAVLGKGVKGAESAGEVVANTFGLNGSRYDYVYDTMTPEEREIAEQVARERRAASVNRQESSTTTDKNDVAPVDPDVI